VTGDDLDQISPPIGEVSRKAKLSQQHDLVSAGVDRQDRRRRAGAQDIERPRNILAAPANAQTLIATETLRQHLAAGDHDVRTIIGDRIGR
jgi:hypothetical protein